MDVEIVKLVNIIQWKDLFVLIVQKELIRTILGQLVVNYVHPENIATAKQKRLSILANLVHQGNTQLPDLLIAVQAEHTMQHLGLVKAVLRGSMSHLKEDLLAHNVQPGNQQSHSLTLVQVVLLGHTLQADLLVRYAHQGNTV